MPIPIVSRYGKGKQPGSSVYLKSDFWKVFYFFYMYSPLVSALKYSYYYFTASNGRGHGIHSPFVFEFIQKVVNDGRKWNAYEEAESLRKNLLLDAMVIEVEDFGAGSVTGIKKYRSIASIAGNAAKSKKFGQLLFRIVNYYHPKNIVELGTSLGISTVYLASSCSTCSVISIEGSKNIAQLAKRNFDLLGLENIELIQANFDKALPVVLSGISSVDLAFIDGNHRYASTLQYFQQFLPKMAASSVLLLDDIHWSNEMESAWMVIKDHPSVMLTIDLFSIGLVFFRPEFKVKQHFTIRF